MLKGRVRPRRTQTFRPQFPTEPSGAPEDASRRQRLRAAVLIEALEWRRLFAVDVLTYHNDLTGSGQNLAETTLTPTNVNSSSFGKLASTTVDGQIYAQPLIKTGVNITVGPYQGLHNVAYVATEHDSLYAIDANSGVILWKDSFINPAAGVIPVPSVDLYSGDITPEVGITSTPVIDPSSSTLFVSAKTRETIAGNNHYIYRIHAIDLSTGAEKFGGPKVIGDTIFNDTSSNNFTYVSGPTVNGTGDGSISGKVTFNAVRQLNRAALSLINGVIYIGFGSHGDNAPYHGWILGYNASNLTPTAVFNTSPNGYDGGIWSAGGRIAADAQGNLYVATGNGDFGTTLNASGFPANADYGDTYLKLAIDSSTPANPNPNGWGLKVADYFTPYNQAGLNNGDQDVGSGTPLLLPASAGSAAHPNLLVGEGKAPAIYLLDTASGKMGKFNATTDNVVQEQARPNKGSYGMPAYFNGSIYYVGPYSTVQRYTVANGAFSSTPVATSADTFGWPGDTPSISANGNINGVLWAIDKGTNELRAYDATTLAELYTSDQAGSRDTLGSAVKFAVPTVANGMLYAGTSNALTIYGLLAPVTQIPAAATNLTAAASLSSSAVNLSWTRNSTNEADFIIMRSPDGVTGWTQVGLAGAGSVSYTDSNNVAASTKYYYQIIATNSAGNSAATNIASATTQMSSAGGWQDGDVGINNDPPGAAAQSNGVFTIQASGAGLGNDIQTGAAGDDFHFVYQSLVGNGTIIARVNSIALTNSGAAAGVMIRSSLAGNASFASVMVTHSDGVLLQARTVTGNAFVAQTIGSTTVAPPQWVKLVRAGNVFTGSFSANGSAWTLIGSFTVAMSDPVYVGLPATANNDGILTTVKIDNVSLSALPATPIGLVATPVAGTQIDLSWNRGSTNDNGFLVERSANGSTGWSQIGATAAGITTFNDTGLTAGSTWYYRVRATNTTGTSGYSNVASGSLSNLPSAPVSAKITSVTTTEIDLAWTDTANNATGYQVFRKLVPTGTFTFVATLAANATSYQDNTAPLIPGTTYSYNIQAFNQAGYSPILNITTATLALAPTTVTATSGAGSIAVSWAASAGATSYNVYRSTTAGGEGSTPYATGVTAATFLDNSVTPVTTYYYKISAVDAGGNGAQSTAEGSAAATAPTFAAHYDFGTPTSPVAAGYTSVSNATTFAATPGYGWLPGSTLWQVDRGALAGTNALTEDFNQTSAAGATFAVNLPNGTYNVTVTMGDALYGHDLQGIFFQGTQVDSITTAKNQFLARTYAVTVTTGQLQLLVKDLGGVDLYDALDGLDIVAANTSVSPTPAAPMLAAATDSGISSSDGVTNFDNSSVAKALQFSVGNTISGATVTLFADGTPIGTATASSTTTTITTNGSAALTNGSHIFTATQTVSGSSQSPATSTTSVKIDTTAPIAASAPAGVSSAGGTSYSFTVTYTDANAVNAATFDNSDIQVAGPGYSTLATFVSATPSGNGASLTATYSIVPPGGTWDTSDNGIYTLTLAANQIGDTAGNLAATASLGSFTVNIPTSTNFSAHYDFGTPTSPVAAGYTGVSNATTFAATPGYGWLPGSTLWQVDRGALAGTNALTEDFNQTSAAGATFAVNLPSGTYNVTVTMGDALYHHDLQGIFLQGTQVDSITSNANQFVVKTYSVTVTTGQLQLLIKDLGGVDLYDALDGLDIVAANTSVSPTPAAPILAAATDSGVSSSDGLTNFDNSSAGKALQFSVGNTVSGATVTLFADGVAMGSATASGATTTITTNGTAALTNGAHNFTATQTVPGSSQSPATSATVVKIDTLAPTAASTPAGVTSAGGTSYSFTVTYADANAVNSATFDNSDIQVTGPGYSTLATFISATPSGNGSSLTATYSIVPPGGTWDASDNGAYTLTLAANQIGDTAGNLAATASLGSFTVNIPTTSFSAHYDFGTPTSPVAAGYTGVSNATTFAATPGYGWLPGSTLWQFDRGALAGTNALTEDFNQTSAAGATFAVNLPNGTYNVTVTMGDALYHHDLQGIFLQGAQVDSITSAANQYVVKTYSVAITTGQLQLLIKDLGGTDLYDSLNALDITPAITGVAAPAQTTAQTASVATPTSPSSLTSTSVQSTSLALGSMPSTADSAGTASTSSKKVMTIADLIGL